MRANDKLAIFENVLARVGLDGDVLGEYHKAISSLNGFQSMQQIQPIPMPQNPSVPPQNPNETGTISPQMGTNTTQMPMV